MGEHSGPRAPGWKLYAALWLALMALRQDSWFSSDSTLVLGFLPVGLAYQAGYSILTAAVMAGLVRYAWPGHLESVETEPRPDPEQRGPR